MRGRGVQRGHVKTNLGRTPQIMTFLARGSYLRERIAFGARNNKRIMTAQRLCRRHYDGGKSWKIFRGPEKSKMSILHGLVPRLFSFLIPHWVFGGISLALQGEAHLGISREKAVVCKNGYLSMFSSRVLTFGLFPDGTLQLSA